MRRGAGGRGAEDHPRSRGVYVQRATGKPVMLGSSPLARGLPPRGARRRYQRGIIPARAGFTRPRRWPSGPRGDHPRSRGVYSQMPPRKNAAKGSSPLARGLPQHRPAVSGTCRIIPARAGFTRVRLYGDPDVRGSSPLARGLPSLVGARVQRRRIIPARAGFTRSWCARRGRRGDHPRSRGVYGGPARRRLVQHGSSPLARGLLMVRLKNRDTGGIIPARAGFTRRPPCSCPPGKDHPRSRGVYSPPGGPGRPSAGSSPLARGLRIIAAMMNPL